MQTDGIIAISAPVSATVLRSHPDIGAPPTSPAELVHWVNTALDVKPHKGPGKSHPAIQRLSRWVTNRLAVNPGARVSEEELLALAQQWLPDHFAGREIDFQHLRASPKSTLPPPLSRTSKLPVPNHRYPCPSSTIDRTSLYTRPSRVLKEVNCFPSQRLTPPSFVPNHTLPSRSCAIHRILLSANPSLVVKVVNAWPSYRLTPPP